MRKYKIIAYMALVVTPLTIACSVGTDNKVTYYFSGNLRNVVKVDLTNNYWKKVDTEKVSDQKKNVLEALLKEDGVGVTLSHLSINSIWENETKILEPKVGTGVDNTGSVLYNCQIDIPKDLSDEDKEKVPKPNPKNCNEYYDEIKPYLSTKYRTHLNITYKGSAKYATSKIKKGEEVYFCAIAIYDNSNNSLKGTIESLRDGKCQ